MKILQTSLQQKLIRADINSLTTSDFDEFTDAQCDWEIQYRPLQPIKFEGKSLIGWAGDVQVDLDRYNVSLEVEGISPLHGVSLVLPVNDRTSFIIGGIRGERRNDRGVRARL